MRLGSLLHPRSEILVEGLTGLGSLQHLRGEDVAGPVALRPMSLQLFRVLFICLGERLENAIGSGCEDNVSKVDGICVCWKTLKDDYTLNLKIKLLFFGLNHEEEFIL